MKVASLFSNMLLAIVILLFIFIFGFLAYILFFDNSEEGIPKKTEYGNQQSQDVKSR